MRAEIVTTGTELLLGQIDDTNATYLARELRDLGIDLFFRSTVGDNELRIAYVLEQALARADLIIVTGGLGPTVDDVTRDAVARVTGRPLVLYPDLLAQIETFFARFGATMSENNRRQAYLPEGCIPVENPVGTAPAFIVEDERGTIITLPGVPREMRYLMQKTVIPYLQRRLGQRDVLVTRILRTVALGESRIDQAIADLETSSNPTVGLSAHPGQTDVRIVAKAPTQAEAEALVADFEAKIRQRLGAAVYATGDAEGPTLDAVIAGLMREKNATLAVAETLTRGELSRRLSAHSDVFRGGVVATDGDALTQPLCLEGLPTSGEPGAIALAEGVRKSWNTSLGLAVLADEDDRAWVAVAADEGTHTRRLRFQGRDFRARVWTTTLALEFLRRLLLGLADGWAD
ncbi:MAG TPA: CinA family nicotinamide mononucleotide deamidase-related protein [Anaerolineae bacterium]|nr:CinA family nicotinamide mononucleotide deamidase-related protein [Anaerolineae bacterium]